MKESVIHFKAESLEDIAQFFEKMAAQAHPSGKSHTSRANTHRANTLRECADILRRTTIEPPKKPRWLVIGEFATENDGQYRTGLVEHWERETASVRIKFGPDGPVEEVHYSRLRPADVNEVSEATGRPSGKPVKPVKLGDEG